MASLKKERAVREITPVRLLDEDDDGNDRCVFVMCILIVIFPLMVVLLCACISYPRKPTPNNLEVCAHSRSGIYKFEILDEIRVKGSEKTYFVKIDAIGTVELAESEYEKYLGGANALPVEVYSISAEIAGVNQYYFVGERYVFPWSESTLPFSDDEKEYFVELICDNYERRENIMDELSLDYYSFGTHN